MVSFSCESCGEVVPKKKLDPHRSFCRNASFTCLDCMTSFHGVEYRSHTSCISEAQKYQGALYKERPNKRKSVTISEPPTTDSRQPYVEDVPEADDTAVAVVSAPPHAPSPPSAPKTGATPTPFNVFDFLVDDETPNASRVSLGGSTEQMRMVAHAPPVFKSATPSPNESQSSFEERGYSYGAEPVPTAAAATVATAAVAAAAATADDRGKGSMIEYEYRTPASAKQALLRGSSRTRSSTDKKRKRQVEDLDLTQARRSSQELDEEMIDAAATAPMTAGGQPILHSGLTGGLNKLLSSSKFPPSPASSSGRGDQDADDDYEDIDDNPKAYHSGGKTTAVGSPIKRKRASATIGPGLAIERTSTARGRLAQGQLVKYRKPRRASDESRPRKHRSSHKHRSDDQQLLHPYDAAHHHHTNNNGSSHHHYHDRDRDGAGAGGRGGAPQHPRKTALKTIEYHRHGHDSSDNPDNYSSAASGANHNQLVVYRSRAEMFLSFVTKGPESEHGCSVNKALKRYHRERNAGVGGGSGGGGSGSAAAANMTKQEEEKELWKALRLRRNERGEIVLLLGNS